MIPPAIAVTTRFLCRHSAVAATACSLQFAPSFAQTRSLSEATSTKVKKKKQKKKSKSGGGKGDKIYDTLVRSIDEPRRKAPRASDEEMERRFQLGKQYVIGRFKRHNENNHDLACKLKMKNLAIDTLPKGTKMREEALNVIPSEEEGGAPPMYRNIAMHTPPIKGFNPADWVTKD